MYETYIDKYIFFLDNNNKKAGHVNKVRNNILHVDSMQINNRGISKLYYYELTEVDVLEIIEQEVAIKFVNNKH